MPSASQRPAQWRDQGQTQKSQQIKSINQPHIHWNNIYIICDVTNSGRVDDIQRCGPKDHFLCSHVPFEAARLSSGHPCAPALPSHRYKTFIHIETYIYIHTHTHLMGRHTTLATHPISLHTHTHTSVVLFLFLFLTHTSLAHSNTQHTSLSASHIPLLFSLHTLTHLNTQPTHTIHYSLHTTHYTHTTHTLHTHNHIYTHTLLLLHPRLPRMHAHAHTHTVLHIHLHNPPTHTHRTHTHTYTLLLLLLLLLLHTHTHHYLLPTNHNHDHLCFTYPFTLSPLSLSLWLPGNYLVRFATMKALSVTWRASRRTSTWTPRYPMRLRETCTCCSSPTADRSATNKQPYLLEPYLVASLLFVCLHFCYSATASL